MLVLSRKVGQRIMIGDNIVIEVTGIEGNKVKLGITAPKQIAVYREEIVDRMKEEKKNDVK
jgi:carbon storage regulator